MCVYAIMNMAYLYQVGSYNKNSLSPTPKTLECPFTFESTFSAAERMKRTNPLIYQRYLYVIIYVCVGVGYTGR